jgi:hypothetical protein
MSRGTCAGAGRARGRAAFGQRGDVGGGILVRRALPSGRGAAFRRLVIRPPRSNAYAPAGSGSGLRTRCGPRGRRGGYAPRAYRPPPRAYMPVRKEPCAGRAITRRGSYACAHACPRMFAGGCAFRGAESREVGMPGPDGGEKMGARVVFDAHAGDTALAGGRRARTWG